jgi:hypothetical protein
LSGTTIAIAAAALVALAPLTGCESSQDKSARLAKKGGVAFSRKGLDVKQLNANVKVLGATVLQDKNGAATVVDLRNNSTSTLVNVPISIDVLGPGRKTVFKNDAAGLETSLVSASVLEPRTDFAWVNDQVTAAGTAIAVDARVGQASGHAPAQLPKIEVSAPTITDDPVSGMEASGTVTNKSSIEQKQLIIYAVARRGAKVVAAGRGEIARLRVGKKAGYHIFFIGDPKGAQVSIAAPPTVLQ